MAYSDIKDPSAHFQAFTYTGTGTTNSITLDGNSDLQPDLYWYKTRSNSNYHYLADSSRGTTKYIYPNDSLAEGTVSSLYVQSFDTNGVTLGAGDSGTNTNGTTFANWAWKANGGTTSSNTDGTITSTVQANQDAGFSIVTYGGTASANTVGHGLADTPDVIIFKNRSAANVWAVYHQGLGNNYKLVLNTDAAQDADGAFMNGTLPTSSVFSVGASVNTNGSGSNYVAYCFAEKQGYSKFGKFVGNGNHDGTFVYTGFKPAFVLMKIFTTAGYYWRLLDAARSTSNESGFFLMPDRTDAEFNGIIHGSNIGVDFLSNGFKLRSDHPIINLNGSTSIYMAFAENPFVAGGIPTTAR